MATLRSLRPRRFTFQLALLLVSLLGLSAAHSLSATPVQQATPQAVATPNITLPIRQNTLVGSPLAVGCELRMAHAEELTTLPMTWQLSTAATR